MRPDSSSRPPSRWRAWLSQIGRPTRNSPSGESQADARDRLLRGYVESRQTLERSIERCECADTSRFLRMIRARVEDRIRELASPASGLGEAPVPLPARRDACSEARVERSLTTQEA